MREIVSPLSGIRSPFGRRLAGGIGWPPSITSSDGDTATLVDNGDDTVDVVIDDVTVGTVSRAQVQAGGFITVVEPVVGMSGNNVVLTTTGYVIHVGETPIETDVEVLASDIVVGSALPFDAAAYPGEKLEARFLFSVGSADYSILVEARAQSGGVPVPAPTLTGSPTLLASWDFGDETKLTLEGENISAIAGSDGTSFTLSSTGTNRPTLGVSDGKAAGRFVRASSQRLFNAATPAINTALGLTFVVIAKPVDTSINASLLECGVAAANFNTTRIFANLRTVEGWTFRKHGPSNTVSLADSPAPYDTALRLLVGVAPPGTTAAQVNVDGAGTAATGSAVAFPTGLNYTTLGAMRVTNAFDGHFDGFIFRILIYSGVLDATQREEVAVWAASNFGTANNA